jgi:hypothetical protein
MHNFFGAVDVKYKGSTGVYNYLRGMLKIGELPRAEADTKKRTSEMLCRHNRTENDEWCG